MSTQPIRKARDNTRRSSTVNNKASGDTTAHKPQDQNKSKCRISKSLRNDLENALVGVSKLVSFNFDILAST